MDWPSKTKCMTKKFTFAVSNGRKCIANLRTQPMHFREDFGKYRTQKVMNVIVLTNLKFDSLENNMLSGK